MLSAYLCLQQFITTIHVINTFVRLIVYLLDIHVLHSIVSAHFTVCFSSRKSFFLVLGNYIHFAEDSPSLKQTSLSIVVETCTNLTVHLLWLTVYLVWHDSLTF